MSMIQKDNNSIIESKCNRPMHEDKAWGYYTVLDIYEPKDDSKFKSLTKHLFVKSGKNISYQKHNHRHEVWTIIDGKGILVLNGERKEISAGDVIEIKIGDKYTVKAIEDLHLYEVQYGDLLSKDDIERFESVF